VSFASVLVLALVVAQGGALVVLSRRLARGRHRLPAAEPRLDGTADTSVSVVVPARNEAERIGPCLDGLRQQGQPLIEAIVVDGASTDATPAIVDAATVVDSRIRRIVEPPRPRGYVGRPWAIAAGCASARGDWVLVVDADTVPRPGMVAGAVAAARAHGFDVVSFAPRIVAPSAGARWLQPAFLTTLVYRFGPAGLGETDPDRAMANGQCMLMRRPVLERAGGYGVAADSYADDIRIVRHLARHGARVGFLDGPALLDVVMYRSGRETWRAWPQSLSMRDATRPVWQWLDAIFLVLAQALPLPLLAALAIWWRALDAPRGAIVALATLNAALIALRGLLAIATGHSFARRGLPYWLSPLADAAAVLRVIETTVRRGREWRGSISVHRQSQAAAGRGAIRSSTFAEQSTPGIPPPGCVPAPTKYNPRTSGD
jgi:dolichol-phosphate mannosyltransferase